MRSRQSGAAQINIFYFVVLLVLFLGAVGFGYLNMTDKETFVKANESLSAENRQLRVDLQLRDHYIEDVHKLIGEAGTYEGREGFIYIDPDDPQAAGVKKGALENVALPATVKTTFAEYAKGVDIPDTQTSSLRALLDQSKSALAAKDKRIEDLQNQNSDLTKQIGVANEAVATANRAKADEVAKLTQDAAATRQWIESEFDKIRGENEKLHQEVRTANETATAATEAHAKQVAELRQENDAKSARIDAQARLTELRNPPQQPDGRVLSASAPTNLAWIDIGRHDMLPVGTVFEIRSPDREGVKARGRVTRVDADRSEIEVYDVADRFDPIVKGDLVRNDLYGRNVRRNIYLMGRFSYPLSKPVVQLALEKLGNKVHDKIGPGVDLVIVGGDTLNTESDGLTPITESDEYKEALALRIEIATVNKIRDFLTLGE